MDVRFVFASNLRVLCDTKESISAVCRDLGINRQQFARYLSGKAVPNQSNIAKICTYFAVSEESLFQVTPAGYEGAYPVGNRVMARLAGIIDEQEPIRIPEGQYWVDFLSPEHPRSLVRAVMLMRHTDGISTFRRLTGWAERRESWWGRFQGNHEGIVVERRGVYFFVAINTSGRREPNMLVMRPGPGDVYSLVGQATVVGTRGPTTMAVVISQAPKSKRLSAVLRNARTYSVDSPEIPIRIIELLREENSRLGKQATVR